MYSAILTNTKLLPYNINNDTLNFVFKLHKNNNLSYMADLNFELFADFGNGPELITSFTTNNYGVSTILFPTNAIEDKTIQTGLFWATGTVDSIELKTNIVRVNFLDIVQYDALIIDANLNGNVNRLGYQIYDASNRSNSILIKRPS